jgi:hypothetical protein
MPAEISLEMYAEKPVVLPFFTGHIARGLLLHFIRQVDPSASGLLHELNVSKPYSVTPLRFRSSSIRTKQNCTLIKGIDEAGNKSTGKLFSYVCKYIILCTLKR